MTQDVNNLGQIKLAGKPKLLISLTPHGWNAIPAPPTDDDPLPIPAAPELVIAPGETISATLRIERNGFKDRVAFEALKQNLPHGVIVDNIGLNGVLIPEGKTQRTIYLTAAKWTPETTRPFYLKANAEGGQTSWPVLLRVRRPAE